MCDKKCRKRAQYYAKTALCLALRRTVRIMQVQQMKCAIRLPDSPRVEHSENVTVGQHIVGRF